MESKTSGAITLVVIFGLLIMGGAWMLSAAVADAGEEVDFSDTVAQLNETQEIDHDTDGSEFLVDRVENETRELTSDEYVWGTDDATINFEEETGEDVTINGTAIELDDRTETIVGFIDPLLSIGALMPLVFAAGAVLIGMLQLKNGPRGGAY